MKTNHNLLHRNKDPNEDRPDMFMFTCLEPITLNKHPKSTINLNNYKSTIYLTI
jgi:hypothetical protein